MRVVVRSLLCVMCCALLGVGAASAATVTVLMTGTWDAVADTAGVLDGSITVGGSFAATFTYDDSVKDCEAFVGIGCFLMNGDVGSLVFTTGNYSFMDQGVSQNGVGTEDSVQGVDLVGLFFDRYLLTGSLPSGVALTPSAYANPTLSDYNETALVSDRLTDIPWDATLFDTNFYFFGPITGRSAQDYIEFNGAITSLSVVPEPSVSMFAALALAGFALRRRCR